MTWLAAIFAAPRLAGLAKWLAAGGWRYLAGAAVVLSVVIVATSLYAVGYRHAQKQCEAAALRAERDALRRDLDIAQASARDADRRAAALRDQAQRHDEVLRDYEERLKRRPNGACALGANDMRRLRRLSR